MLYLTYCAAYGVLIALWISLGRDYSSPSELGFMLSVACGSVTTIYAHYIVYRAKEMMGWFIATALALVSWFLVGVTYAY